MFIPTQHFFSFLHSYLSSSLYSVQTYTGQLHTVTHTSVATPTLQLQTSTSAVKKHKFGAARSLYYVTMSPSCLQLSSTKVVLENVAERRAKPPFPRLRHRPLRRRGLVADEGDDGLPRVLPELARLEQERC